MKKIKEIFQQINPFVEHKEQEQPMVPVIQVPPLPEPVIVGENLEAMIREEYLRQQIEETHRDGKETIVPDIQLADSMTDDQDKIKTLQQEDSLSEQDCMNEEIQNTEVNLSPVSIELDLTPIELEAEKFVEPEEEPKIIVNQEPDKEPSLLENRAFVKLAEECTDLMNEFDGYAERLETVEGKMMAEMVVKRMQELLERAGLERIDDVNTGFLILQHKPEPMMPVSEGLAIKEIIQSGLKLENRVFRKAKVIISL